MSKRGNDASAVEVRTVDASTGSVGPIHEDPATEAAADGAATATAAESC